MPQFRIAVIYNCCAYEGSLMIQMGVGIAASVTALDTQFHIGPSSVGADPLAADTTDDTTYGCRSSFIIDQVAIISSSAMRCMLSSLHEKKLELVAAGIGEATKSERERETSDLGDHMSSFKCVSPCAKFPVASPSAIGPTSSALNETTSLPYSHKDSYTALEPPSPEVVRAFIFLFSLAMLANNCLVCNCSRYLSLSIRMMLASVYFVNKP